MLKKIDMAKSEILEHVKVVYAMNWSIFLVRFFEEGYRLKRERATEAKLAETRGKPRSPSP